MVRVLRSYIQGGLIGSAVVAVVCFMASYLTAQHVDTVVADKLKNRQLFEAMGSQAYQALGHGDDDYQLSKLKALADQGFPGAASRLAWAYDKQGMVDQRDALLMSSLDTMVDPDLLAFLTVVAPAFDELAVHSVIDKMATAGAANTSTRLYHSTQTHLLDKDIQRLRGCFTALNDTYSQDNGKFQNRYAYFADKKSCRLKKGTHDANPART
jgi:hypothetical protein